MHKILFLPHCGGWRYGVDRHTERKKEREREREGERGKCKNNQVNFSELL